MGFNPMGKLLSPAVLNSLPPATVEQLTSRSFFPQLISASFHHALDLVLIFCVVVSLMAAAASWVRGEKYVYVEKESGQKPQKEVALEPPPRTPDTK
jgi:hypothetical protein